MAHLSLRLNLCSVSLQPNSHVNRANLNLNKEMTGFAALHVHNADARMSLKFKLDCAIQIIKSEEEERKQRERDFGRC